MQIDNADQTDSPAERVDRQWRQTDRETDNADRRTCTTAHGIHGSHGSPLVFFRVVALHAAQSVSTIETTHSKQKAVQNRTANTNPPCLHAADGHPCVGFGVIPVKAVTLNACLVKINYVHLIILLEIFSLWEIWIVVPEKASCLRVVTSNLIASQHWWNFCRIYPG